MNAETFSMDELRTLNILVQSFNFFISFYQKVDFTNNDLKVQDILQILEEEIQKMNFALKSVDENIASTILYEFAKNTENTVNRMNKSKLLKKALNITFNNLMNNPTDEMMAEDAKNVKRIYESLFEVREKEQEKIEQGNYNYENLTYNIVSGMRDIAGKMCEKELQIVATAAQKLVNSTPIKELEDMVKNHNK